MVTVSIVSMVKNEENFIEDAVKSILSQDVNLELIIVDDKSDDNTLNILKGLAEQHPNMSVMINYGQGKVAAFLQGCAVAKGDYLAFFAGDDIMPKGSLKQRLEVISQMASPSVTLSKIEVMSEDQKIDGLVIPKAKDKGNPSGACIMIDREAAKYLLDIPSTLPNEDTWMDLCVTYLKFLNVRPDNIIACKWRVHAGNSISIKQGFEAFNVKFGARMNAMSLFLDKYDSLLDEDAKYELKGLIECENFRKQGNIVGIILTSANLREKLKFSLYSNKYLFKIRSYLRPI